MNWTEELKKDSTHQNESISFAQYMDLFISRPEKECRTTCLYLKDIFDFYGKNPSGGFNLFTMEEDNVSPVFGQTKTQDAIYQNLVNFTEEGFNNKFLLLVGPNGSAKTSLVKKIMKSAEKYSLTDDGALYCFSWIFPIDNVVKGNLGLGSDKTLSSVDTYAHLDDNHITAILASELKDHPLLLLPIKLRQKMIEEHLVDNPKQLESLKNSYFYSGDMSKRNRMVYDALLQNYKGDHQEVLKHIRVERFHINPRYSSSAVTIEPQLHVDAKLQQITMDKRLASLPPSLQSLNLFNMQGEVVLANRGILEFSDLLKRPLDTFKYLLMTMESKTVNLQGILTELDICFVGTSNEIHLSAFKQHPDFNSFKGRFQFLKVPYLLNADFEGNIYKKQIDSLKNKVHFEPNALDTLCYWAIMTRLRPPLAKNYEDKDLSTIVTSLNPLEKAQFLTNGNLPERFDSEQRKLMLHNRNEMLDEFDYDELYEGKFGISPREMKQIIFEISSNYKYISFIEVLEYLKEFIERKTEHDFLNIAAQGDYNNLGRFIELLEAEMLDQFDNQARKSLGLIDERSYENYVAKYVMSINALIKNEKIRNPVTSKFEAPNEYFIKEFESNINLAEDATTFRSNTIANLGAYSLDNPGEKIIYCDVFPNLVALLQQSFRGEQKKVIDKIATNLIFYIEELKEEGENPSLSDKDRQQIKSMITELQENCHYSQRGSINILKYLIKKRY